MPIGLNVNCKKRLTEVIAEGLPNIRVSHGMFLNDTRILGLYKGEGVIPKNGNIRDQLVSYIDDFPVISFCGSRIARALYEREEYLSSDQDVNLTDIEGYKEPKSVAESLVADLDSLPWKYTLTIDLPSSISELLYEGVCDFQLADGINLIVPSTDFSNRFPLSSSDEKRNKRIWQSGYNLLLIHAEPKWMDNQAYFQIVADGYVDMYGSTNPANRAVTLLKAFCGLGMALRAFDYKYSYFPMPIKRSYYVHRLIDDNWEIDGKFNIPEHDASCLANLQIHNLGGRLKTEQDKVAWIKSRLNQMRTVFSAGKKAESIMLASQWLFDSYARNDELLSFVQTMVALEILLGDEATPEQLGLGNLLRNRCAYLISDSQDQRKEILRDFERIYKVRSQIVHRGKSKLTSDERVLLNHMRWMCRRVIQEEVNLLTPKT